MAQAKQDMGTGSIKKLMLQLMIPAVVAQVVNLLYNIVDRIYIGHIAGIGAAALTGVGLFTPILMLLNAFAMLVGAGGAPRTAIALGQGDRQQAEKIISNSFTMLMFFAVVSAKAHWRTLPLPIQARAPGVRVPKYWYAIKPPSRKTTIWAHYSDIPHRNITARALPFPVKELLTGH